MYYYHVYGLTLQSNKPVPRLRVLSTSLPADLELLWYPAPYHPPTTAQILWRLRHRLDGRWGFSCRIWPDHAGKFFAEIAYSHASEEITFTISPTGDQVWIGTITPYWQEYVEELFTGFILAYVLHVRGVLCMHASVIAIDDCAILLLGESGTGKSTTAGALAREGHPILADDMAAIIQKEDQAWVYAGYPAIRLVETSVGWTDHLSTQLSPVWTRAEAWQDAFVSKVYLDAAQQPTWFVDGALPLAAIYVLAPRSNQLAVPVIEPLRGLDRLHHLTKLFKLPIPLSKTIRMQEMRTLSNLATRIPIRQLKRPDDLASLPQVCTAILADVQATRQAAV